MAARVTVNDGAAPSDQLIKAATAEVEITDANGRKIKLKNPGIIAQFRLAKTVGAELAENGVYMRMVLPLLYVSAIDGDPIFFPSSDIEIEALIQRLDEAGVAAVITGVNSNFAPQDPEVQKAELKK